MVRDEITALSPRHPPGRWGGVHCFAHPAFLLVTPWRDRGCRRGPGLVTPPEGIHGRGAASPLPSMFGRASPVSAAIISCIMIKTETGGRGCAVLFRVSLLRDVSLGVPLLALGSGGSAGA